MAMATKAAPPTTKPEPTLTAPAPERITPAMAVQTANALITGAHIDEVQLRAAMPHYKLLAEMLSISGPRFANAQREATLLHNRAVARLRERREDRMARERRAVEAAEGLTELSVE